MADDTQTEKAREENLRLPTVAIVGRPNVGKSTLFNRIVGKRKAVVLDTPGVTRDRNFERAEWNGRAFNLIDTGGYETDPRDGIYRQMREQSLLAVEQAELALLVVDVRETDNPVDQDVAQILRRSGKPMLLAVNKCDGDRHHQEAYAFYSLGFEDLYSISGLNGFGVGDLLDRVVELLPEAPPDPGPGEKRLRIAVIGRPNVGKSTLVNSLLGEERVIASDLPGTTRDPIDTDFEYRGRPFTLIDTAGLRRRGKIEQGTEKLCSAAAQQGIARSDVALILIDAREGLTQQDEHVAGYAFEEYRCCILVVNKWDLVEKDSNTAGEYVKKIRDSMGYLSFAPVVMVSALTGQRVRRVLDLAEQVYETAGKRIDTAELNRWLEATQRRLSPPFRKGRQLRIKYVTQTGSHPPSFTFFVNNPELMHFSYQRFLINRLREDFGLEGVPIRIRLRRKSRRKGEELSV